MSWKLELHSCGLLTASLPIYPNDWTWVDHVRQIFDHFDMSRTHVPSRHESDLPGPSECSQGSLFHASLCVPAFAENCGVEASWFWHVLTIFELGLPQELVDNFAAYFMLIHMIFRIGFHESTDWFKFYITRPEHVSIETYHQTHV